MLQAGILVFVAICIFLIGAIIFVLASTGKKRPKSLDENLPSEEDLIGTEAKARGLIKKFNNNGIVDKVGSILPSTGLDRIFFRAKNPWHMSKSTFQFIRFGGAIISLIFIPVLYPIFGLAPSIFFPALIAFLCFWYPKYYYKAVGDEREAEWNKMYEFIWVLKHNVMLYDPAKSFINTRNYVAEHAPHDKEIIAGFQDFYEHWNPDYIDEYIEKYYPFSVTREIYQIIFNMNKTGDFPEDQLNSLREFVINAQNLTVEKNLSGVSGKATIFSLPFLMVSVIIALLVPMILQLLQYM